MQIEVEINAKTLNKLRKLRLWHWDECLRYRALECYCNSRVDAAAIDRKAWYNSQGNFHISQVTVLNDFFPRLGDTAECDANYRDGKLTDG